MTSSTRIAENILTIVVRDAEQREAMIGDLREEFSRYSTRVGADRASRWHMRQCLGIAVRYGFMRLLRRKPPVRWISIASMEADSPGWSGMNRDLRYAWRAILQRPGLAAVIVSALALALATNSTTFAMMDAIVLRPYRFPGVERLLVVATQAPDQALFDRESVNPADFVEWRAQSKSTTHWAMYTWWETNLSGVDIPEQLPGFRVSPGFFSLLGVAPMLGREFTADEAEIGNSHRVVLGHGLWTRRFGADPAIIGTSVRLDGEQYEVIGVAPDGFEIPLGSQIWSPIALNKEQWADRRPDGYAAFAKLADNASIEQARAEILTAIETQRRDHPTTNAHRVGRVLSFTDGMADAGAGPFLAISQSAAVLLLLIACANIANLLMARGSERSQEYAVRLALGASRARIFTQTMIEGLLLSALGIVLAMPLILIGLALSRASIPTSVLRFLPGWRYMQLDVQLFTITAALGTAAMLVFSLIPAFQAMRSPVGESLRQSGRTLTPGRNRQWLRSTLATTQVALALALLFASTLAVTAANKTVNGVLGFDKQNVLVGQLILPTGNYEDPEKRRQFIAAVTDSLKGIPALSDIGVTSNIPAGFSNSSRQFWPEGAQLTEAEVRSANFRRVSAGYFPALKIPLVQGRMFDDRDRVNTTPVAVISTGLAAAYWPNQDPLGKRFKNSADGAWVTVIGVAGDVVHNWFVQRRDHTVYRPVAQDAPYAIAFAARTVGDPTPLAGDLRAAVRKADPDLPIASLAPLEELVEERAAGFTFIANALGVVSLIALGLSLMGLYSLMAFLTMQRTQEIGVRIALGAGRWQVIRATTKRAVGITIAGSLVGGTLAFALGRVMQATMFGLISTNVVQLIGIVLALAFAALLAAYLPARRASRLDPMTALRQT